MSRGRRPAWRRRSARIAWRSSTAGAACCWAACRACRRPRSSILGGGVVRHAMPRTIALGMGAHRHRGRPSTDGAAQHRHAVRLARAHHVLDPRCASAQVVPARRPGDRRGAGAGRRGAEAGHAATWSATMKPGSVIVDIAIDQGGCFETSPADHALRPDLRRRRRRALLRHQHAGRGRRAPRPSRSTTPRCRSCWRSPTTAGGAPSPRTRICATASTFTTARFTAARSPRR